jgi:nucleotide-binding universal stress UspA family protein
VVIAFDGSDASRAALERAADLFPGRAATIATVWEPGIALQLPVYDSFGSMAPPPDPQTVTAVDRTQRDHATQVARAGAELATSLGLSTRPRPVEDEVDAALAHRGKRCAQVAQSLPLPRRGGAPPGVTLRQRHGAEALRGHRESDGRGHSGWPGD